jgi:hypothetical protein
VPPFGERTLSALLYLDSLFGGTKRRNSVKSQFVAVFQIWHRVDAHFQQYFWVSFPQNLVTSHINRQIAKESLFYRKLSAKTAVAKVFSKPNDGSIPPPSSQKQSTTNRRQEAWGKENLHLHRHRRNCELRHQSVKGRLVRNGRACLQYPHILLHSHTKRTGT